AGLEFRRERFAAAAALAEKAVERDHEDRLAWRLLATSRFLAGEKDEALSAWNAIEEPRLDLVRIEGLVRTPYRKAYGFVEATSGELLPAGQLRRPRRRLASLPTVQAVRVDIRPRPDGRADLEAALVERPMIEPPLTLLVEGAVRALTDKGVAVDLAHLLSS